MKVSVLIPVYNAEKYLRQCLDSVRSQTHKEIEIIIVDDGSIDSSGAICDQYAMKDKRVNVIHQTNHGLIPARLRAIEACRGRYITFVDADDLLVPNAIETMYQLAIKHDADIVACKHQTLSAHGFITKPKKQIRITLALFGKEEWLPDSFAGVAESMPASGQNCTGKKLSINSMTRCTLSPTCFGGKTP